MAVTSQLRTFGWSDVEVNEWRAAGLLKRSAIKSVIATYERDLVIERLDRLVGTDQQALRANLLLIQG
jgi:hypothetical protein